MLALPDFRIITVRSVYRYSNLLPKVLLFAFSVIKSELPIKNKKAANDRCVRDCDGRGRRTWTLNDGFGDRYVTNYIIPLGTVNCYSIQYNRPQVKIYRTIFLPQNQRLTIVSTVPVILRDIFVLLVMLLIPTGLSAGSSRLSRGYLKPPDSAVTRASPP